MNVKDAYNRWAAQYDSDENKTRDMEAKVLQDVLGGRRFGKCLELGCGTGKNTQWLLTIAPEVLAIDFSDAMLAKAKGKLRSDRVRFVRADLNDDWDFAGADEFDLVTFSLVLEHIENLNQIFEKLARVTEAGGFIYISELHPFRQYSGSQARFESESGIQKVTAYTHHVSDFIAAANEHGFRLTGLSEHFDEGDRTNLPRLITLLFEKN